jgi:hypothetical protein
LKNIISVGASMRAAALEINRELNGRSPLAAGSPSGTNQIEIA